MVEQIKFLDENGTFTLRRPENVSGLYFPLASETGLKSAVSPNLGGDAKLDQETFLLEPVSIEDLHASRATRNIWCKVDGSGSGRSPECRRSRSWSNSPRLRMTAR